MVDAPEHHDDLRHVAGWPLVRPENALGRDFWMVMLNGPLCMKGWRVWLLVVLVALLPFREAVADGWICRATAHASSAMGVRTGHAQYQGTDAPRATLSSALPHEGHGASAFDAGDCRRLCSGACAMTPLPSAMPSLPSGLDAPAAAYPPLQLAATDFFSGGLERPPRSI